MAEICSAGESAKVQFTERNNAEMSEDLKILAIMPGFYQGNFFKTSVSVIKTQI